MDFDEWFESLDLDNWTNKKYMHDAFEAGQKSKQAEIEHRTQVSAELAGELIKKQAEIDALKNLIDEIVGIVREADLSDGDSSVAIVHDEIQELLK